jgi:hypothetical protein
MLRTDLGSRSNGSLEALPAIGSQFDPPARNPSRASFIHGAEDPSLYMAVVAAEEYPIS